MKLFELARRVDESARHQAAWAVGSTLFWRGHLADARAWLPASAEGQRTLGWTLALLGEREAALALPRDAMLHFYLDAPEACLAALTATADPLESARSELLRYWALTLMGEQPDEAATQAALARLRHLSPCDEARGMAIYAVAAFHRQPRYALPHLDHALDLFARFGLHYLEARLLGLKARALDAAGLLGEGARFQRAATEAGRRQGVLSA